MSSHAQLHTNSESYVSKLYEDTPWLTMISDWNKFETQCDFAYQDHVKNTDHDYTYVGNIKLDFDYLLNLPQEIKEQKKAQFDDFPRPKAESYLRDYNYVMKISKILESTVQFDDLKKKLEATELFPLVQWQARGGMVGVHTDGNRDFSTIIKNKNLSDIILVKHMKKYIVFLDDWDCGQAFLTGRQAITNWKQGDVMSFPWYMRHATCNASLTDRPIIFVSAAKLN